MKVIAKFKGKDGLKGYATGKVYSIVFMSINTGILIYDLNRVRPKTAGGTVMYTSLIKFLDNWEVVA